MLREAGLYALVAVVVYLLVSLWTYSPSDPGWFHSGFGNTVVNAGGRAGAWISDIFFNLFGFVAYLFPILGLATAWRQFMSLRDSSPPDIRHRILIWTGFVLTIIGACGLASLHFGQAAPGLPFNSGGAVGQSFGGGLAAIFSFVGATIFLLALFLSGVTLFTGLSWLRAMDLVGQWTIVLSGHARYWFGVLADYVIGLRAKRIRQETVAVEKKTLEKHPPPRIEPVIKVPAQSVRVEREKQVPLFTDLPASGELPPLSLLDPPDEVKVSFSDQTLAMMSQLVVKKLSDFNIEVQVVAVHPGPVITRFEIDPAPGVKASQITNLAKDLARSLSVVSLRVVENIPGKSVIGIEVPNENREIVRLSEGLSSQAYEDVNSPLALALGKDIGGNPVITDLGKMPHLLIAGTTGSGKSVCINALILSLVYKSTPDQVRMIMVDPKMLELAVYEGIPHLLAPVVTDMKEAANVLRWALAEMERRYRLMAALGVRNIAGYNHKIKEAIKAGKPILDPFAEAVDGEEPATLGNLHYIVILIDELADMMMVVG